MPTPANPDLPPGDLYPFDNPRTYPTAETLTSWIDASPLESDMSSDPTLSAADRTYLRSWFHRVVEKFHESFDDKTLPPIRGTLATIVHDQPVYRPSRPIRDPDKLRAFAEIIKSMIGRGILKRSSSMSNHQAFLVPKSQPKSDRANDRWRMVNDLSALNSVMEPVRIDPPTLSAIFGALAGAVRFSSLDMVESFWQLALCPETGSPLTAFQVPPFDKYEFRRLPMGLQSSSSWMERNVRRILAGYDCTLAVHYIDDICTFSGPAPSPPPSKSTAIPTVQQSAAPSTAPASHHHPQMPQSEPPHDPAPLALGAGLRREAVGAERADSDEAAAVRRRGRRAAAARVLLLAEELGPGRVPQEPGGRGRLGRAGGVLHVPAHRGAALCGNQNCTAYSCRCRSGYRREIIST